MELNKQTSGQSANSSLIFILGLLGVLFFPPLGIAAWIMGKKEKSLYPDDSMVKAGYILGIIASCILALTIIALIVVGIFFVFIIAGVTVHSSVGCIFI